MKRCYCDHVSVNCEDVNVKIQSFVIVDVIVKLIVFVGLWDIVICGGSWVFCTMGSDSECEILIECIGVGELKLLFV